MCGNATDIAEVRQALLTDDRITRLCQLNGGCTGRTSLVIPTANKIRKCIAVSDGWTADMRPAQHLRQAVHRVPARCTRQCVTVPAHGDDAAGAFGAEEAAAGLDLLIFVGEHVDAFFGTFGHAILWCMAQGKPPPAVWVPPDGALAVESR